LKKVRPGLLQRRFADLAGASRRPGQEGHPADAVLHRGRTDRRGAPLHFVRPLGQEGRSEVLPQAAGLYALGWLWVRSVDGLRFFATL
jgi:hypothetical protein